MKGIPYELMSFSIEDKNIERDFREKKGLWKRIPHILLCYLHRYSGFLREILVNLKVEGF